LTNWITPSKQCAITLTGRMKYSIIEQIFKNVPAMLVTSGNVTKHRRLDMKSITLTGVTYAVER